MKMALFPSADRRIPFNLNAKTVVIILCNSNALPSAYNDSINLCKLFIKKGVIEKNIHIGFSSVNDSNSFRKKGIATAVSTFLFESAEVLQTNVDCILSNLSKIDKEYNILVTLSSHGFTRGQISHDNILNRHTEYIEVDGHVILDEDLHTVIIGTTEKHLGSEDVKCNLLLLIDTCSSGTMLNLPYSTRDGVNWWNECSPRGEKILSYSIAACEDGASDADDISDMGWGGGLTCSLIDILIKSESVVRVTASGAMPQQRIESTLDILDLFTQIRKRLNMAGQHPILSSSHTF